MRFVHVFALSVVSATFVLGGCGKDDEEKKGNPIVLPQIAPIVASATPEGLRPGSALRLQGFGLTGVNEDAATYIMGLFKNKYGGMSGTTAEGYINSQLTDLDFRLNELASTTGSTEVTPTCWQSAPNDYTVNASTINPILTLPMKVNCNRKFDQSGGDQSGKGSGLIFGKSADGVDFYAWLTLFQQNGTDVFGFFGGVKNAESAADREVDYMFLENFPQFNRVTAARLYAKPSTKTFELHYASGAVNLKGPMATFSAAVGCGMRMISDGNHIYATGRAPLSTVQIAPTFDCATEAEDFEVCLNAVTLAAVDGSACGIGSSGGMDESFRFSVGANPLDSADVKSAGAPTAVTSTLTLSNADSVTTPLVPPAPAG